MPASSPPSALPAPKMMTALTLHLTPGDDWKPGRVWHPAVVESVPVPTPKEDQVLVKIFSAGFNHRDVFQRQSQYPGTVFSSSTSPSILGADAVGVVLSPPSHPLFNRRVLLAPAVGWLTSPFGPDCLDQQFGILGSVKQTGGRGTFAEYVCVGTEDVVECPGHLRRDEAAAAPLAALTAYRAVFTKAGLKEGQNVLITGIGGGVAILALQFCVAAGANVWVSSSSDKKIKRAVDSLGAKGGIKYTDSSWPKTLAALLPSSRPYLDAVIDSGGGPIANQVTRVIKDGGVVACYGQTSGKPLEVGMGFVLKNAELKGSTMGSRDEFFAAIAFIAKHEIHPVVDTVLEGLEQAEQGFELLKKGGQFGKVVITISKDETAKL